MKYLALFSVLCYFACVSALPVPMPLPYTGIPTTGLWGGVVPPFGGIDSHFVPTVGGIHHGLHSGFLPPPPAPIPAFGTGGLLPPPVPGFHEPLVY